MKALEFLNSDQVCKRWDMEFPQLRHIIYECSLPIYDMRHDQPVPIEKVMQRRFALRSALRGKSVGFKTDDILSLEEDTPGLRSELSGKDAREFGRLKREAEKTDEMIKAAVLAGLTAAGGSIKKADLWAAWEASGLNIPETTFRKIWKMIPKKHRKRAGRPKKT